MVKTRNMNLVETRARAAEQAGGEGGEEGGLDRKGADLRQRGLQHQGQLRQPPIAVRLFFWAMAKNGSSRSFLGQKRVGRIMKAANTQFGLT